MRYRTHFGDPKITDCIPETKREHELLCKAFPYLVPFQYITTMGTGGQVFKKMLGVVLDELEEKEK